MFHKTLILWDVQLQMQAWNLRLCPEKPWKKEVSPCVLVPVSQVQQGELAGGQRLRAMGRTCLLLIDHFLYKLRITVAEGNDLLRSLSVSKSFLLFFHHSLGSNGIAYVIEKYIWSNTFRKIKLTWEFGRRSRVGLLKIFLLVLICRKRNTKVLSC